MELLHNLMDCILLPPKKTFATMDYTTSMIIITKTNTVHEESISTNRSGKKITATGDNVCVFTSLCTAALPTQVKSLTRLFLVKRAVVHRLCVQL